jgi:hypothetical protein
MQPTEMMTTLLLGGLMGLLGQGARTVVGLKGMSEDAKDLGVSPNDLFQAARILTSLMIGFLVGLAAALIFMGSSGNNLDWHQLLAFAAAGYTGTDFLEGFISNYLTPSAKTTAISNARRALVASVVKELAATKPTVAAPVFGDKEDAVLKCCIECLKTNTKAPKDSVPNTQGTMNGTFHFGAGEIVAYLTCISDCLKRKGYVFNGDNPYPTQEAFLGATLGQVSTQISLKTV